MRAFGGKLTEFGDDFDESRVEAERIARDEGLFLVPPFHHELVRGVATYALELFTAVPALDTVYVPIGCGSGICGMISMRDALGLDTEIVGVVSENAPTAKLSAESGRLVETNSSNTFADGIAVRVPVREAFDIYSTGALEDRFCFRRGDSRRGPPALSRHAQSRRRRRRRFPCRPDEGKEFDSRAHGGHDFERRQHRRALVFENSCRRHS